MRGRGDGKPDLDHGTGDNGVGYWSSGFETGDASVSGKD